VEFNFSLRRLTDPVVVISDAVAIGVSWLPCARVRPESLIYSTRLRLAAKRPASQSVLLNQTGNSPIHYGEFA
jgi:hypothetical protein